MNVHLRRLCRLSAISGDMSAGAAQAAAAAVALTAAGCGCGCGDVGG
jgi:hypothetical protein